MSLFEVDKNVKIAGIDFTEISLSDRSLFCEYYERMTFDKNLWCLNFPYLFGQNASNTKKVYYKIIDGMFCCFIHGDKSMYMVTPPIGECDQRKFNHVIAKCLVIMNKVNGHHDSVIHGLSREHKKLLNHRYFNVRKDSSAVEYTYDVKAVYEHKGKEFETIRRKLNKFARLYPNAIWREYQDTDWQNMMQLKTAWEDTAKSRYFRIVDASYYRETIRHHRDLDHKIFVVELNHRIIGMISCGYMGADKKLGWCFLRKPLNNFEGLSEFLIWKLCEYFKDTAVYMNDGDDDAEAGLRFFKTRFNPVYEKETYACSVKKGKNAR